ncbi:60S ribosomal protein L24 [Turnera subulata]|uniref:60S ribosomal protein L24 n=1 Tax=Turnera subulata TaxID=218843 RepID=A0A9Q0G7V2_9ROSI|nr:60S ribosomal protein L24 [Turnera subulata]
MEAMFALQSSMGALSLTSSGSFFGQRLSIPSLSPVTVSTLPLDFLSRISWYPPCFIVHGLLTCVVNSPWKPCLIVMKIKPWERKKCKPNSLPVLHKMHVKVGDTVKVISGDDKGKIGEITKILRHNSTVVVGDINLKTKHVKSKEEGEPGQIIKIEAPIHSSNVMLYSKEKEVASRVGHKTLENGKRVRYLIKTGEIIDSAENWKKLKEGKEKKAEVAAAS